MRRHAQLLTTLSMAAALALAAAPPASAANAERRAKTPSVDASAAPAPGARRHCARDLRPFDVRHARCSGRTGRWW